MWEYEILGLQSGQTTEELHNAMQKIGARGFELVCVIDQSADELKSTYDCRMLLFKRKKELP